MFFTRRTKSFLLRRDFGVSFWDLYQRAAVLWSLQSPAKSCCALAGSIWTNYSVDDQFWIFAYRTRSIWICNSGLRWIWYYWVLGVLRDVFLQGDETTQYHPSSHYSVLNILGFVLLHFFIIPYPCIFFVTAELS